ncbi:hypothetical protein [Blastomonas sp.]|uniref:hypothetical protein n=1 Tax=Blastomonas sp. TaxID=1909299 RepID=UPI002634B5B0|nr:hypothetical protein [Blastomonas sp.]MDM7954757.1 hypothetical protein [Blastomonas sp.]
MAKFNPSLLVPANAQAAASAQRSAKEVALANIDKQKHLFNTPEDKEGKRTFKSVDGGRVQFTLRVSNTPLVLGQYEVDGVKADVREMTVPAANFAEALDYFADKLKAGEFDGQLAALDEKKTARTAKLRKTRSEKKAEAKPA